MMRCVVCALVLCLSLPAGLAAAQGPGKEKAAVAAAQEWLALVDEGKYGQSWKETADYFRNAVTREQWEQSLQAVRSPLGKLAARKVHSAVQQTSLPGAPDGQYVVIRFETSFAGKKSAVETVTTMLGTDGGWRVAGYFIK